MRCKNDRKVSNPTPYGFSLTLMNEKYLQQQPAHRLKLRFKAVPAIFGSLVRIVFKVNLEGFKPSHPSNFPFLT